MSENEIKPVAWVERSENGHDRMWSHSLDAWANRPANPEPLYSQSAIDRLTAERDALRADAERYRYLCDVWGGVQSIAQSSKHRAHICTPSWHGDFDTVDAAIDAARAKEGQA